MQTRDQKLALRALAALDKTRKKKEFDKDQYGGMAHKLPVLVQTCGLCQALVFVQARGKDSHKMLLEDLAATLHSVNPGLLQEGTARSLLDQVQMADLAEYMHLTRFTMQALLWFKRFAQSELDVDSSAGTSTDPNLNDGASHRAIPAPSYSEEGS